MSPTRFLQLCTIAWLAAAALIIGVHLSRRRASAGLVLAYVANLAMLYWLGAVPYTIDGIYHGHEAAMLAAMPISCVAVFALAVGAIVVAPLLAPHPKPQVRAVAPSDDSRIALVYFFVGAILYALLPTSLSRVPSITSLIAGGQNLATAGVCLCCWTAWNRRQDRNMWGWLGLTLIFPLVSTLAQGMMGALVSSTILAFTFVMSFYRPRGRMVLVAVVLSYVGLTVYNSYMRDRSDIRRVVWGGASTLDRIQSVMRTLTTLEPLSVHNDRMLYRIDERLNQNVFLGDAITYMAHTGKSAHGATLGDALFAVVPRALWINKPIRAGGGDLVSEYTGITFAEGTSIGVGQVLELYINFGTFGVAIGFVVLGTILSLVDWQAGQHLLLGRWRAFVFWFLLGMPFLVVGGALAEVSGTIAGSVVVVWLVNHILLPPKRRQSAPVFHRSALLAIENARAE